jgi:dTMP kinase
MGTMLEHRNGEQRGLFLVVDGVDGCGKTTQAGRLAERLGVGAELHLREPGSTDLGEALRALLLDHRYKIEAGVETLMFAAARRQMLEQLVEPALAVGKTVVCERFHPSTFSYQAVAGDLAPEDVLGLLHGWAGSPKPDLILLLDIDVDQASERRGVAQDRIEAKGLDYQRRVAEGYRMYAEQDAAAVLIDGGQSADAVFADIMKEVERVRQ